MQLAFYLETGGEIQWGAAKNFAHDPAGIKVLLSGSMQAGLASAALVLIASIISRPLYNGTQTIIHAVVRAFTGHQLRLRIASPRGETVLWESSGGEAATRFLSPISEEDEEDYEKDLEASSLIGSGNPAKHYSPWICRISSLTAVITTIILAFLRPKTYPYAHMSGSIPYTLLDILTPPPDICLAGGSEVAFPFPELVSKDFWEHPSGQYIGWMPTGNTSTSTPEWLPAWLPQKQMHGFERWYKESDSEMKEDNGRHGKHNRHRHVPKYDPVQDPLRISNLDSDVLEPITEALKDRK